MRLPSGLPPEEEAAWWDAHRDYWDTVEHQEEADEVVEAVPIRRTKPITMRLPVDMIEALKREAEGRAIPYQALIRMWLKERLARSQVG
jgi:predicted DNA binding CopG/RHH family protein